MSTGFNIQKRVRPPRPHGLWASPVPMVTSSHQQMPSLRWARLPAVGRLGQAMPARTYRIPSGGLPSPTRDWNCWLWEGKGVVASARGRGPPTPRCQPSVMRNTQVCLLHQKRVHACLSLRITTVSFCLKSNGMDLRLIDGLAGRTGGQVLDSTFSASIKWAAFTSTATHTPRGRDPFTRQQVAKGSPLDSLLDLPETRSR